MTHSAASSPDSRNPAEQTARHPLRRITHNRLFVPLFLLLWAAGLGASSLYLARAGYSFEMFLYYLTQPKLILLNLLPVLAAVCFLYALTGRVWITTLGSALLILFPSIVHYLKLAFRGDPLMASDILYISEAMNIGTNYSLTADFLVPLLFICAAALVGVIVSFFLPKHRWPVLPRLLVPAALVLAAVLLYKLVYLDESLYYETQNTDLSFSDGKRLSPWSDTDRYVCHGFLYPLLHSTAELGGDVPENYDEAEAAALLSAYSDTDIPDDKKVNVVSIMLEAYNDFSKFDSITFVTDPYTYLHELQAESWSGTLVTNIFAGGTIDTERGFLTGNTRNYNYRKSAGSFVRYFQEQGYHTAFTHPCYEWFYNRANVCDYLGFAESWFYETRYDTGTGAMMKDAPFFDDLIELYDEATADGDPYFHFSVTYQNHGPYPDYGLNNADVEYVSHNGLSNEAYYIANNYFNGIAMTNAALETLVNHLRADDEPVVLVLFGDHNPWMGDGGYVYQELGINIDPGVPEGFYNYYSTPYIIWANDAAKAALGNDFIGDGGNFSPCFLMNELFKLCGWEGDAFMQANRELRAQTDIIHTAGLFRPEDTLTGSVSPETRTALDEYYQMAYYRKQDLY